MRTTWASVSNEWPNNVVTSDLSFSAIDTDQNNSNEKWVWHQNNNNNITYKIW